MGRAYDPAAMTDLGPAVRTVVRRCLAVQKGENVVVVVDSETRTIGEALRDEAAAAEADAVLIVMDERATDGGARGATMPGVTEDMLGRVMAVDFDTMAARSKAVAALLESGTAAHVTCPRGTDLRLALDGRAGISDDGELSARGAFGNLPCGEGFIAPAFGEGTVVASSLSPLGIGIEPAALTVAEGRIVAADGGFGPQFIELLLAHGELGTNLAELGVGTNDRARLTGNVLEDEKILGTVHVAFGASAGIGGTVSVPIHLDVVVLDASLEVDGQAVLDHGRYVLG